jgi:hypothetical protein
VIPHPLSKDFRGTPKACGFPEAAH